MLLGGHGFAITPGARDRRVSKFSRQRFTTRSVMGAQRPRGLLTVNQPFTSSTRFCTILALRKLFRIGHWSASEGFVPFR